MLLVSATQLRGDPDIQVKSYWMCWNILWYIIYKCITFMSKMLLYLLFLLLFFLPVLLAFFSGFYCCESLKLRVSTVQRTKLRCSPVAAKLLPFWRLFWWLPAYLCCCWELINVHISILTWEIQIFFPLNIYASLLTVRWLCDVSKASRRPFLSIEWLYTEKNSGSLL